MGRNDSGNLYAFLAGGLLGAGLALMFAPKSGRETREQIKEYAKGVEERVKTQVGDLKDIASNEVHRFKDKAQDAVKEGKKAFKEEMDKFSES